MPRGHLDALGRVGLLGLSAPPELGGSDSPEPVRREVAEVVAGSCGTTWFCWVQHATPLAALLESDNEALRATWLRPLSSGEAVAGIAFAHLRRPDPPAVVATRGDGGWRFDGRLDWVTSWDVADVVMVAARGAPPHDDRIVFAFLEPAEAPGLAAGAPLALAAMGGTHTCPVTLDGLWVRDADVALLRDHDDWRRTDGWRTSNASPPAFGVTRAAVAELARLAAERGSRSGAELAASLAAECREVRREAYHLIDDVAPDEELDRRLTLRAHALELAGRSAAAVIAMRSGAGMLLTDPAQRWAREALFLLVQAQTPLVREATLRRLADLGALTARDPGSASAARCLGSRQCQGSDAAWVAVVGILASMGLARRLAAACGRVGDHALCRSVEARADRRDLIGAWLRPH